MSDETKFALTVGVSCFVGWVAAIQFVEWKAEPSVDAGPCSTSCAPCPEVPALSQECAALVKAANPLERYRARYVTVWDRGVCIHGSYLVNGTVQTCAERPLQNKDWANVKVVGGLSIVDVGDGQGPRPYWDLMWLGDGGGK